MEDDIDIEEHDVLDNPRIRNIFPDLTQIKQEIPDDQYHDPDQEMGFPYPRGEGNSNQGRAAEYSQVGSKIILGSKPTHQQLGKKAHTNDSIPIFGRKPVEVKQEIEEFEETEQPHEEEEYHPSTVMILGSKPSNSGVIEPIRASDLNSDRVKTKIRGFRLEFEDNTNINDVGGETEKKPTSAFVLVEDWGPRLQNSPCFCKECKILFSTRNTLLAHNMTAHSFLVAVDKNKAKKSTSKPNETGKFCNHCNKMFPDSDSLINHLYEKLTFDKNNAAFKAQSKNVANSFNKVSAQKHGVPKASTSNDGSKAGANMYRCEICSFYCEIYGFFLKHMQNNHGINTASKEKVVFTGICLYCNTRMKTKSTYNHHLKLTHLDVFNSKGPFPKAQIAKKVAHKKPELIPKSSNQFSQMPIKTPVQIMKNKYLQYHPLHKFQCQKCSEIFQNYFHARRHRKLKHPELATQNIFKKITNFGNKTVCVQKARVPSTVAMKLPNKPQKPAPQPVLTPAAPSTSKTVVAIPKAHLFKCNKCNIHFTSCTATVLHAKFCTKRKGDWNCDICKRDFQDFDVVTHKRQHQVCNQFSVIVVSSENLYGRILNKCPKCDIYFHEKDLFIHEQKSVCKGVGVKCEICTYPIHPTSAKTHSKWHERVGFNKKNVIVVEFANLVVEEKVVMPVKRPAEPVNNIPAKKSKVDKPSDFNPQKKVYYCHNCGTCLFRIKGPQILQKHTLGKCKSEVGSEKRTICKFCGLYGHAKNHLRFHRRNPETNLIDMKFLNLKGNKFIFPPFPNFPRCTKCLVHFGKQETVNTHTCDDSYKTCGYCHKRFSDLAYKLHIRFHEYHDKFRKSNGILVNSNCPTQTPAQKPKFNVALPELLQKYEMLTNTWNILFHCETCDIVCDSYDMAVEHSQKHFNNMESYDVIVRHCDICDLNFDGASFEKHGRLHTQNKNVGKSSFTIQPYKYYYLFTVSWLKQFRNIPQTQLNQILSRSIYRYARSVKLRVVQPGAPENALYRCGKCGLYIHPISLPNHYKNVACGNNKFLNCAICGLPFNSINGKVHHEKMHKITKTFMVVYFNEEGDDEFNEKLRQNDIKKRNSHLGPTVSGSNRTYHYYRCVLCKTCITQKEKAVIHKCALKFVRRCNKCQLQFHAHVLSRHMKLHELNPNFVKKNIKITPFKNNIKTGSFVIVREEEKPNVKVVKLYKCPCGLHFISTEAADKHLMVCGLDIEIAKEKCSQCDRFFDTTQLVTHLCKHHVKDDKPTKFEDINVTANKDEVQALVKEVPAESLEKSTTITTRDEAEDHATVKAVPALHTERCIVPVTPGNTESQALVKAVPEVYLRSRSAFLKRKSLYKCPDCDVHYLSPGGLAYHFEMNHQLSKVRHCPHCNLKFMPMTLRKHIIIQHENLQYTLDDFIIHSGTMQIDGQLMFTEQEQNRPKAQSQDERDQSKPTEEEDPLDSACDVDVSAYSENLYKCKVCNAHFMGQKSYYSHLQRNVNPIHHESELIKCPGCDYTFRKRSLIVHLKVHHDTMKLDRDDLKIQVLFPMPKQHRVYSGKKRQIPTDEKSIHDSQCSEDINEEENNSSVGDTTYYESVYRDNTVRVREKAADALETSIVDDSVKTYKFCSVLYKCGYCDSITFTDKIENHVKSHLEGKTTTPPVACWCGLAFTGRFNLNTHEQKHHEKGLGKDDLYVITLSSYNDTIGDNHIFRCGICQVYFPKLISLQHHLTSVAHYAATKDCSNCGLAFQSASIKSHKKIHHENMNLHRKDFIIMESVGESRVKIVELGEDLREKEEETETTDNENVEGAKVKAVQLHAGKDIEEDNPMETSDTEKSAKDFNQTQSNYKATLHKCDSCGTHYLDSSNLVLHQNACPLNTELNVICEECQLQFSKHNLNQHKKDHHQDMNLKAEDFEILQYCLKEIDSINKDATVTEDVVRNVPESEKENIVINKEERHQEGCNQQLDSSTSGDNNEIALMDDVLETDTLPTVDTKNCVVVDSEIEPVTKNNKDSVTEAPNSLENHSKPEPEKSEETPSSSNASAKRDSDNVIKLYKCAVCNVCFLSQISCYRHATKHVTLDPKDYIECKLCGYQFLILSNCLHKHITKHHNKSFKPENVLIEEYHPDILIHDTPKINIYFGTDKLQSKLISTTCEASVTSTSEPGVSSVLQCVDNDKSDDVTSISIDEDKPVNIDDSVPTSVLESV